MTLGLPFFAAKDSWSGLLSSFLSGGLAGAIVSNVCNRLFHWSDLRRKFYPSLKNMFSAYVIRFNETSQGQGRYWVNVVGQNPKPEDAKFVDQRSNFIDNLVAFNELKEARELRQAILDNAFKRVEQGMAEATRARGFLSKLDLQPEFVALETCMRVVHKKLKMDQRGLKQRLPYAISNIKKILKKPEAIPHVDSGE